MRWRCTAGGRGRAAAGDWLSGYARAPQSRRSACLRAPHQSRRGPALRHGTFRAVAGARCAQAAAPRTPPRAARTPGLRGPRPSRAPRTPRQWRARHGAGTGRPPSRRARAPRSGRAQPRSRGPRRASAPRTCSRPRGLLPHRR
eukprot:scaffold72309_cov32-Tisochrysis_lutea.AAC.3